MDALKLLESWPAWSKANSETILSSPAWRMSVTFKDTSGALVFLNEPRADALNLAISLDDEEHILGLYDSPAWGDLHRVWTKRAALPSEVLLALVEKECGGLFQMIEDSFKKLFRLKGLAPSPAAAAKTFAYSGGGKTEFAFSLNLSSALTYFLGRLANLDVAHDSVRSLERPARVEYATLMLLADEVEKLAAGDYLLLPENATPSWTFGTEDEVYRVQGVEVSSVTFAACVDEALPPPPPPAQLQLVQNGRVLATGGYALLGVVPAFKLEKVG